jgi:hypothetical protein
LVFIHLSTKPQRQRWCASLRTYTPSRTAGAHCRAKGAAIASGPMAWIRRHDRAAPEKTKCHAASRQPARQPRGGNADNSRTLRDDRTTATKAPARCLDLHSRRTAIARELREVIAAGAAAIRMRASTQSAEMRMYARHGRTPSRPHFGRQIRPCQVYADLRPPTDGNQSTEEPEFPIPIGMRPAVDSGPGLGGCSRNPYARH